MLIGVDFVVKYENVGDISLSQTEYCFLVGRQYAGNKYFKIKIPRLMPNVLSHRVETFNRNILVNAKECKPSVNSIITTQNFITVERSAQCSLFSRIDNEEYETIPSGVGVICTCTSGNYRDMKITDVI